jgi:uncharacterized protein (DUF885 family)
MRTESPERGPKGGPGTGSDRQCYASGGVGQVWRGEVREASDFPVQTVSMGRAAVAGATAGAFGLLQWPVRWGMNTAVWRSCHRAWCARGLGMPLLAGLVTAIVVGVHEPVVAAQPSDVSDATPETTPNKASTSTPVKSARSDALRALLDEHVAAMMREFPEWASQRGIERWNDKLTDWSADGVWVRRMRRSEVKGKLRALPRDGWTESDHLDADLLEYDLTLAIEGERLYREQMPINAMDGPHIELPRLSDQIPFLTPKHYSDYAARLEAMPRYIEQQIAAMDKGLKDGRTPPKVVLSRTLDAIAMLTREEYEKDPTTSPFYRPFLKMPSELPVCQRAQKAIAQGVIPAFRELHAFMERYIPKCRDSVGLSQGVDGIAAYEHQLRVHTTTSLTAKEIHEIGLTEVARIEAEMVRVIRTETDFVARDKARAAMDDATLLAAFLKDVRTDARFIHTDKDAMLRGYRDIAKRIDAELPSFFGRLPRNTYGVRELPAFAAKTSPSAYYYPGSLRTGVPGYFMVNTLNLTQRPRYTMISLTLHEAVPGHHLQGSISEELRLDDPTIHEYRSLASYTAFVEGWALYAEKLGLEMGDVPIERGSDLLGSHVAIDGVVKRGLYADPYDYFGSLSDEIWRACRLVVDTGIHAFGWSRQDAINYLLAHSAISQYDAESETDRYIGWPGQACAYKIGQIAIINLRREAEAALGAGFDRRAFHDCVLGAGALPLPVLEKRVKRWIGLRTGEGPAGDVPSK